jgi:hypothetical protein
MDMIVLGQVERITARHGEVLQLRPKAANSKALTEAIGAQGEPILTLPRGFYLKKNFTGAPCTSFPVKNIVFYLFCELSNIIDCFLRFYRFLKSPYRVNTRL